MSSADTKNSVRSNLAKVALGECEERFRIFMETTREGVIIHDRFKILEINQAFADMVGLKPGSILGRDVLEFIASDFRDDIVDKLLAGDESPLAVSGCKKDGIAFPIEFCSRIVPQGGNRVNLTLFRPLSNPVQTAPRHPGADDGLGLFFDLAPDAYYLTDETGTFIDVNKAAQGLFGHKKEIILGKSFLKLKILAPDQIHRVARNLALNILGKPADPEEYVLQRRDGQQIPVEISARPVKINGHKLMFGIVRDITDKKKTEAALHRAVKEIEALVEKLGIRDKGEGRRSKNKPPTG
jgi:PAS domain S-box-containing protein